MFYVKPNSNCGGLQLTSLSTLLGGQWSGRIWTGRPLIATGDKLTPRRVVGWSSLFGGNAVDVHAYVRHDGSQVALLGADWGIRILANENEAADVEVTPGLDDHLPPGWGSPILTIEDLADIHDTALRAAITAAIQQARA